MTNPFKTLQEIRANSPGLLRGGSWRIINIEPKMPWPSVAQEFQFNGHNIWLIPVTQDAFPGLAILNGPQDRSEGYGLLYRALSVVSWMQDAGATIVGNGGGSPLFPIYGIDRPPREYRPEPFDLTEIPQVDDPNASLCLALMREGRGIRHPAYSFLSFFRIVERAMPQGRQRGQWIEDSLPQIDEHRAVQALKELRQTVDGDVGQHLYESGRCAVAHAGGDIVANPDEPADYLRLSRELPLMEALACRAIEKVFGIKTASTIYREHHYELRGWKEIFGAKLIKAITAGEKIPIGTVVDLPQISVRLRLSDPFDCLERMYPKGWAVHDRRAEVQFASADGVAGINLLLDFDDERQIIAHETGVQFRDNGTPDAALVGKQLAQFVHALYGNGELQIWNAENGQLIGKSDAYIPVNVMLNPAGAKAELDRWDGEIIARLTR